MEKKLQNEFKQVKEEVSDLRSKLNITDVKKESWFNKKEELKKYIIDSINKIRQLRSRKNKSDLYIQRLKAERDSYNKKVKDLIENIKNVNKEKLTILKKHKIDLDPSKINEKIQKLEEKIETEAIPIEAEQKIMKQIKELKKIQTDISSFLNNSRSLSEDIEKSKQKAEEAHNKLKEELEKKKKGYEEFIALSKEIDKLRVEQEQAFKNFLEHKKQFLELNNKLKDKLLSISKFQQQMIQVRYYGEEKKQEVEDKQIEEKAKLVEDKIRNKKKLTTEDLLVFQNKK